MLLFLKIGVWLPIATLLYPLVSAPIMLPMMLARPLQLLCVLVVTGLRAFSLELAIGFVIAVSLCYSWTVFVPPRDARGFSQWLVNRAPNFLGKLSQVVLLVTMLGVFLYLMETWNFNPVIKWFASFGTAYYVAGVAMGIVNFPTMVANELLLRRLSRPK